MAIKRNLAWIILIALLGVIIAAMIHEPDTPRTATEIPLILS